jgi:hypothetical protein
VVRWQYRIVCIGSGYTARNLGIALSYFGQRGWELQTVFDQAVPFTRSFEDGYILFKRPVPDGEEPDGPWSEVWSAEQVTYRYEQEGGQVSESPDADA